MQFIDQVKFVIAYSFMYSSRPGTPAANLKQISLNVKKARLNALQALLKEQQIFLINLLLIKKLKYFLIVKEDIRINILGDQFIIKVFLLKLIKILLVQFNKFELKDQQILH